MEQPTITRTRPYNRALPQLDGGFMPKGNPTHGSRQHVAGTTKGTMNTFSSTCSQVERRTSSVLRFSLSATLLKTALLPLALLSAATALAQNPAFTTDTRPATAPAYVASSSSSAALPDDPSVHLAGLDPAPAPQTAPRSATSAAPTAPKYTMTILAGYHAQPLTSHEKVVLGFRDMYSPSTFIGEVASAGYSHITNGQPNYGTDKGAFGQRVGASVLRDASEDLLSEVILAPILHEDARYYIEGSRYNFFHRTIYAATRPIITRTDSGKSTINASVLIGYAGASALSYTYYPAINQNFKDTAATYGGALAGAAVGDFVNEFLDDVLQTLHLEKKR